MDARQLRLLNEQHAAKEYTSDRVSDFGCAAAGCAMISAAMLSAVIAALSYLNIPVATDQIKPAAQESEENGPVRTAQPIERRYH